MSIAVMTRADAFGWVAWAASHRLAEFMCSLTVEQLKEGAELAIVRGRAIENSEHAEYNKRLIAEYARRARNNVGLVMALDMLGCDTAGEAAAEYAAELRLGAGVA
jgi:hypothetical protein